MSLHGELSRAEFDVIAERRRHVSEEGWTVAHDDRHASGELAAAGAAYALGSRAPHHVMPPAFWPWKQRWWKPATARRMLVKAASLIIAEIERWDRAHPQERPVAEQEKRFAHDPQPAALCKRPGGCVCGGDTPGVRAGCQHWKGDD